MEKIVTKDRILAKIKIIRADFRKAVDIGQWRVVVCSLCLYFIAYAKVYGEAVQ